MHDSLTPPAVTVQTLPSARFGSAPAASVISEVLRIQSTAPERSAIARAFGRSPLSAEAQSWYIGALGELDVAERLATLGPEWTVLHSLPVGTRGSDIDHLLIGPGGVFTINTKFHEGANVWLASRRLMVNGQKTEHLRNARYEATRVAKLLTRINGSEVTVHAIVALVGIRKITVRSQPTDVSVLRERDLARSVHRRKALLGPDEAAQLACVARSPATWAADEAIAPDISAFADLRRSVRAARRVRITWAFAAAIAGIGTLLTLANSLPALLA